MSLTKKKKAFARAKVAGLSNRDAALKAGYSAGTASSAGSRLAKDEDVAKYLAKIETAAFKSENDEVEIEAKDPMDVLLKQMNSFDEDVSFRAAAALMPYFHAKKESAGKKESRLDEAKGIAANDSLPSSQLALTETAEYKHYS